MGFPHLKQNILEAIGWTPLVRLNKVMQGLKGELYAKLEYMNPGSSVKDRIAVQIIDDAERSGALKPGATIVEATSGNTGMGLAMVSAVRGYKPVFVITDKQSPEKVKALRAFGAKVVITPTNVAPEDPRSYYSVANRLAKEIPNAILANQYHNPSNPMAHYKTTGPEIWEQTEGKVDTVIIGMGTGGTISGVGRYLKEKNPKVRVVGVDPLGSVYAEYFRTRKMPPAQMYKIEGIGEDFLPSTMDFKYVDEVVSVNDKEAFLMTRDLVRKEGIFSGGSSGAAVAGAIKYAAKLQRDELMVVLIADSGSRYLSKIYDDDWMREHSFLDYAEDVMGQVRDLLKHRSQKLISAKPSDKVKDVIGKMKRHGISQLPVVDGKKLLGIVSEVDLLNFMLKAKGNVQKPVKDIVETDFLLAHPQTPLSTLMDGFTRGRIAVVVENEAVKGIVSKIDIIDYLSKKLG